MTVIAWDGVRGRLAADKRMTERCGLIRTVTKIEKFVASNEDGDTIEFLVAVSGDSGVSNELMAWFMDGGDPMLFPTAAEKGEGTLIVFSREMGVQQFVTGPEPTYLDDDLLAFGAGRDFAMAALSMGMSAEAAVDLACQHNVYCGSGIDILELTPLAEPAEDAGPTVH